MNNIFILTKTMVKGIGIFNAGGDSSSPGKKNVGKVIIIIFLAITFQYLGGIAAGSVVMGNMLLKPLGFQTLIPGLLVSSMSFLIFFFGIFHIMSVFYFSNDIERLLSIPVKPGEIILAKFFTALLYEYMTIVLFFMPGMVAYGIINKMNVIFYLYVLIVSLFLPVVPLVIAALITMGIMSLSKNRVNKDKFSMFAGVLGLFMGLGINVFIQSFVSKGNEDKIADTIINKGEGIAELTGMIFPGTVLANKALITTEKFTSVLYLLAFIVVALAFLVIMYYVSNLIYFRGVVGISTSGKAGSGILSRLGSKRRDYDMHKYTVKVRSPFLSYLIKEARVLLRTPVFFMNNILMNFLMPLFLFLPILATSLNSSDSSEEMGLSFPAIKKVVQTLKEIVGNIEFGSNKEIIIYILLGFFALLVFTAGSNGITETGISREGKNVYIMKILPMRYSTQIKVKIAMGIIISFLSSLMFLTIIALVFTPPFYLILFLLAVIPGAVLFPNISGIIFDLYMPKINWDTEQKAVKQNMNVLLGIVTGLILIAAVGIPVLVVNMGFYPAVLYIIFCPIFLAIIAWAYVNRIANKYMLQLSV